jgi:general secretion pathway protein L
MSHTLVLLTGAVPRWLRIADGNIVARGDGLASAEGEERVVAVLPADDVTISHAELPDLSEPQAQAAARLMVAENAAAPVDTLHVAVGAANGVGNRPVVAVDRSKLADLLTLLADAGYDPDSVVAAPMLVARPDKGFVKADLGTEVVVRGRDGGFADDPVLTPLLAGGAVMMLDRARVERELVDAVTSPEVDLRQGAFAKRRNWGLDKARLKRIGWLALGVAALTLLFSVVQLVRLNMAADRIEANNLVTARAALPPGTNVNNALLQVREQLNAMRGPGGGLIPLASSVTGAVDTTPNIELTSMIFDGGGTLRITARAPAVADLTAFEAKLSAAGLTQAAGPTLVDQGRQMRDYTVSVR